MNKVLLIGGEGYIGKVARNSLINEGYHVTSYDLLLYQNGMNIDISSNSRYSFIHGDILDVELLENSLNKVDAVVLLAGLVGDPITKKYPNESAKINDNGVKVVIDKCVEKNIEKLIFISTCSNYGLIKDNELADEEFELSPLSLYAKSKVKAEKYILSLKGKVDLNPTILRFATAFGLSPRMRFDLTISEFTRSLAMGNDLLVYDAETWRPYCHVQDFARLIHIVLKAPKEKVAFEVFNAGGDVNNATKQMIVNKILSKIPNGNVKYQEHGSDPRNYRVDFKKVKAILGFEPKYTIQDGIDELVAAIDSHVFDHVDENRNFHGNYEINCRIAK